MGKAVGGLSWDDVGVKFAFPFSLLTYYPLGILRRGIEKVGQAVDELMLLVGCFENAPSRSMFTTSLL